MRLLRYIKAKLIGGYKVEMQESFKYRCEVLFNEKYPHNAIRLQVLREMLELTEEYLRLSNWDETLPSPDGLHWYIKGVSKERGLIDPIGLADVFENEDFVFPTRERWEAYKQLLK